MHWDQNIIFIIIAAIVGISRLIVPSVPPAIPAEANEPGAWIAQEPKAETNLPKTMEEKAFSAADASWKDILRSSNGLRRAIVLREIFGPPRAMRDFETV